MKMFKICYVVTCPDCHKSKSVSLRGMGESHVEWIERMKTTGVLPCLCDGCRAITQHKLTGVSSEQEGAGR